MRRREATPSLEHESPPLLAVLVEIRRPMGPSRALAFLAAADSLVHGDKLHVVEIPGRGRGVVAARRIEAGERIELVPVIPVPAAQVASIDATVLAHYVYDWEHGGVAVALGCGSLYNHSYEPNASYRKDFERCTIEYLALVDIAAGSEILINYNGDPADRTPLWFDVL